MAQLAKSLKKKCDIPYTGELVSVFFSHLEVGIFVD